MDDVETSFLTIRFRIIVFQRFHKLSSRIAAAKSIYPFLCAMVGTQTSKLLAKNALTFIRCSTPRACFHLSMISKVDKNVCRAHIQIDKQTVSMLSGQLQTQETHQGPK